MYKSLSLNLNAIGALRDVYQCDREFIVVLQAELIHNGTGPDEEIWLECVVTDEDMKAALISLRGQMVHNDILIMAELEYAKINNCYCVSKKVVIELKCILKNIFDCFINGESQAINLILNR
jgi:hypothetical protein